MVTTEEGAQEGSAMGLSKCGELDSTRATVGNREDISSSSRVEEGG